MAFSIDSLRANPSTLSASTDVSEHNRETNYTTQKHTTSYNNKVQVWNVTCEENAHKIKHICNHGKNAKCVCVLLILFKENQAQEIIRLACLSLEVMEGPLIFNHKHLDYPYIQTPTCGLTTK